MIKDVFIFKKNAWHLKLMKYIWGYTHKDFTHMCPYFWLSILNCIIFILVFFFKSILWNLIKIVIKLFSKIREKWQQHLDANELKWYENSLKKMKDDYTYLGEMAKIDAYNLPSKNRIRNLLLYEIKKSDDVWREYNRLREEWLDSIRKKEEEDREKVYILKTEKNKLKKDIDTFDTSNKIKYDYEEEKRKSFIERKNQIARVSNGAKYIAKFIGYSIFSAICLYALYWIYKFFVFLSNIPHSTYVSFGNHVLIIIKWIIITTLSLGLIALIIWALCKIPWYKLIPNITFPKISKSSTIFVFFNFLWKIIKYPFIYIWKFIKWIGLGFIQVIELLKQMLKDNCPALRFED